MLKWYQGEKHLNPKDEIDFTDMGYINALANEALLLKENSNLGQRFLNRTFGSFDSSRDKTAFDVCVRYANSEKLFSIERNSLIILGAVGSGKTHLSASIANTMVDRGIPVLFATFLEHLESIKREFDGTGEKMYLSKMKSVPLLVLDDIGREKQTDWSRQVLFDVVNYRYEHLAPIVLTSNLSRNDLKAYLGRDVDSRLGEMSVIVETKGDDYRNVANR